MTFGSSGPTFEIGLKVCSVVTAADFDDGDRLSRSSKAGREVVQRSHLWWRITHRRGLPRACTDVWFCNGRLSMSSTAITALSSSAGIESVPVRPR